jgi:hypothetical protein
MRLALIVPPLILALSTASHADMIVNAPDSTASLRLADGTANPASLAAGYSFSALGAGTQAGNPGPWGELIAVAGSPNEFYITATHYAPDALRFTNAAGQTFTYAVATALAHVGSSDLAVGVLSGPVDPSITPFLLAQPVKVGDSLLMTGRGENTPKVGFAAIDTIQTLVGNPGHPRTLTMGYSTSTLDAAWVQPGDSGSGSFILEADGTASLASIHLSYSGPPVSGQPSYSVDTDLTMQIGAIDAALVSLGASGGIEVHGVPEPSSLALIEIGLAAAFAMRRRRVAPR